MSEYEIFNLAQNGDDEALGQLYDQNKNLIYSLMKRFSFSSEEKEDLFQVGSLGLIKAIQNFDSSYNVKFSTYAVPLILGELRKYFRESTGIKVARSLKELGSAILKKKEEYMAINNKEPSIEELSSLMNIAYEDVVLALESFYKPTSLDKKLNEESEDGAMFKDFLSEEKSNMIGEYIDLDLALSSLDDKERLFIHLRYYENMTQKEIADRLFTSQVNVSRMEKRVLNKMKERLVNYSK